MDQRKRIHRGKKKKLIGGRGELIRSRMDHRQRRDTDQGQRRDSWKKMEFINGRREFAGSIEWIRGKEETVGRSREFIKGRGEFAEE
jgi:hypothetical protein